MLNKYKRCNKNAIDGKSNDEKRKIIENVEKIIEDLIKNSNNDI